MVFSTVLAGCDDVIMVKEEGFQRAGKFGRFTIQPSVQTRKLFVDAYSIVRTLGMGSQLLPLPGVTIAQETVHTLVSMLAVPSSEARSRAIIALISLASQSLEYHQVVAEAETVTKIIGIIPDASPKLKVHIFAALDKFIRNSRIIGLKAGHIETLTLFLSPFLSLADDTAFRTALSLMVCVVNSAEADSCQCAFTALLSSLSLELSMKSQLFALKATTICVKNNQVLITGDVFARLSRMFASSAYILNKK